MNWKRWLYGLVSTVINSIASGVVLLLTGLANDPMSDTVQWQRLGTASIILGLLGAANYLSKSPAPEWNGVERRSGLPKVVPLILLVLALPLAMPGCGHGPKTNPVGAIAYNADQVAQVMGRVEKAVMNANAAQPPLLTTDTTRTVLKACYVLDEQNLVLAGALEQLDKLPLGDSAQRKPLLAKVSLALDVMNVAIFDVIKPIKDDALKEVVTALVRQVSRFLMTITVPGVDEAVSAELADTYWRLAA